MDCGREIIFMKGLSLNYVRWKGSRVTYTYKFEIFFNLERKERYNGEKSLLTLFGLSKVCDDIN
jgi:hypothetical protein